MKPEEFLSLPVYCRICNNLSKKIFEALVLDKHKVAYYKCDNCGFIQTSEPFWLEEAYSSAITSIDIGLLHRNFFNVPITTAIISRYFNPRGKFIDYGGGYGVFTRLMRDKGLKYFRQDLYCDNLFAKHFDIENLDTFEKFEFLTAFEVFEHLLDPQTELEKMLEYSDSIFFSTELVPAKTLDKNWWYFMPQTGQHISLYSKQSLLYLAKKNNLFFTSNGSNLHLLSKKPIQPFSFKLLTRNKLAQLYCFLRVENKSLLMQDYEHIKKLASK